MKKVKTPIVKINGTDYTNELKGKTLAANVKLFEADESSLPNSSFNITIRRPYKKLHGYTDLSSPDHLIVNGVLYNSRLDVILNNVTANHESNCHISNGTLYYNYQPVEDEDSGWTDLSNQGSNQIGTFTGIKNGNLYLLEYTTRKTKDAEVITKNLYAWTYTYEDEEEETHTQTIYTDTDEPEVGDTIYNVYLYESGTIDGVDTDSIEYSDHTYERDSEKDTTGSKTIPAEYTTKLWIDLLDDTRVYVAVCGNPGAMDTYSGWNGYALTSGNQLYKIDYKTFGLSLAYSNITTIYKAPKVRQAFLIKASNGTVRHIKFATGTSDSTLSPRLGSDIQFIAPDGYWGSAYHTNCISIRDGNLYSTWTTEFDTKGYWTHASVGYECAYGICDGHLYKLYGTDSSWYNKTIEEIKLIDSGNVWIDLYCGYSDAYGLTKDGRLYYIKDNKISLIKTGIPVGVDYNTQFLPQTILVNVGEEDSQESYSINKSLLETLVADAEP